MKGIIFQLLEAVVVQAYGDAHWERVLSNANVDGAYTSLGSYPDSDLTALAAAAAQEAGLEPEQVVRWFGRQALPILADRYPEFFEAHNSTVPFLLTLNDIIHVEVRKIYPGAEVPHFDFAPGGDGVLMVTYHSGRALCMLAEGLIEGAADHFDETASIVQPTCKLRGDPSCVLACTFQERPPIEIREGARRERL